MEKLFVSLFFAANILYCSAYVVRDIFWLRVLTIIAAVCTFPYFYFQETPLYSALFWQSAFLIINAINLTVLFLERRPVDLSDDQKRLHLLLSRSFTPRELLKLLAFAEWKEAQQNEIIIKKGISLEKLQFIFHGMVKVEVDNKIVGHIQDGGFIGEMSFASGEPTSADVIAMQNTSYLCWQKDKLNAYFVKHPHIKETMWTLLGIDMAAKLRTRT
ncbi:popeye domain-containing protein [bacterium]|nr:popeye domain-containing protein [bacterium]